LESEVDDAALISIDSKGVDIRVRQGAQVLTFLHDSNCLQIILCQCQFSWLYRFQEICLSGTFERYRAFYVI
jgi:hypothetical protein